MDKISITELAPGEPLAYPVVCELEQNDDGCALWCPEFSQRADGLDVEHAKRNMVSYITQSSIADRLRSEPAVRTILLLRLSDNVLDPPEWPVYRVRLEHGKVVSREVKNRGVYTDSESLMPGATLLDVAEWLAYDGTGCHPENYYEVFDPRDGQWHSFIGPRELEVIGEIEISTKQWHEITREFYHR